MDLEQLKHRNSSAEQTLTQPYQPIIYAIPKSQWEAMLALMTENLPYMDTLATEENMAYYYQETEKFLRQLTDSQSNHRQEISSQVGRMSEQNSKWVRDLERFLKNQMEQQQEDLQRKMIWMIAAQSAFLSILMILLMWILR